MTLVACRYFWLGPLGPVYQYQYVYCSRTQIVIRVMGEAHAEIYPEAWDGGPAKGRGGKDELFKDEFQCSPEVGRMLSYG